MKAYALSDHAISDLEEIALYFAEISVGFAEKLLSEFEDAFHSLSEWRHMGRRRIDLTEEPLLFWSVRNYLIVYGESGKQIIIVSVLHGARDVASILQQRFEPIDNPND
jgi:plasmid stabilization system protein ParE